ncbi:hypothetical protein ACFO5K_04035 [Nocardia halotolerans]|uniref:Uncharacterized protein n=1 Tax=Nocardia halotolerans TaxID=1755878 RepID=A0ABV8VEX8_9NOCA
MTTTELTAGERAYFARGYLRVDETRDRLHDLINANVNLRDLAEAHGLGREALNRIINGRRRFVPKHLADTVADIDIDIAADRYPKPEPYLDNVTLDRIALGHQVAVASYDKPLYARALYKLGWTQSRIARALTMSGAKARQAIEAEATA